MKFKTPLWVMGAVILACAGEMQAQKLKDVNTQVYTLVLKEPLNVRVCAEQVANLFRSLGWSVDQTTVNVNAGLVVANEKKQLVITGFCQPNNKTIYLTATDPFQDSSGPSKAIQKILAAISK